MNLGPDALPQDAKAAKGQPNGLWVLFITEMWERFSYYGMRALLVFYLVAKTSGDNPGFGWNEGNASELYGWYTGLVYLTPNRGRLDRRQVPGDASFHACGRLDYRGGAFLFGLDGTVRPHNNWPVTLATAPGPFLTFMTGLVLIIIGTGFFKPCVSVMVGQLYGADDPRRDSGFTIFYMGINVGAFLSGVVAGTLGEKIGWHWGFGSAGVGMILGLIVYQIFRPMFLHGIGLPPHHEPEHETGARTDTCRGRPRQKSTNTSVLARSPVSTGIAWPVVMILGIFAIAFWIAFEQAGSSLNLFALNRTDRVVFGYEFPATWYQSINPAAIVLFARFLPGFGSGSTGAACSRRRRSSLRWG